MMNVVIFLNNQELIRISLTSKNCESQTFYETHYIRSSKTYKRLPKLYLICVLRNINNSFI